jgi:hypothetical protein
VPGAKVATELRGRLALLAAVMVLVVPLLACKYTTHSNYIKRKENH